VSDPEGRHTVMEFFRGGERVYPVGRLDYLSEGLLLLTNDGALANALTRASAGVEKTYLVKVSGKPSEAVVEQLRTGIMIEKGRGGPKPGSGPDSGPSERIRRPREGRVMTAPARIRLVRDAENPWYEMSLIEGRNREIRKMFEEIGHHVEKIRRVGYGPLVLDVEPGKLRELEPNEVELLRRAAMGRRTAMRTGSLPGSARLKTPRAPRQAAKKSPRGNRKSG
jgi:23S rRNA pseudouridine2605 synthase